MKISVNKDVFETSPQLQIGFVYIKGFTTKDHRKESRLLVKDAMRLCHMMFHKDTIQTHALLAPWHLLRDDLGMKHHHTSVEKLLKKVLTGKDVTAKNTFLNIIYYLSLKYIIPFGLDDMAKVNGDITFFRGLSTKKRKDVYYKDAKGPLGRKFDYWSSPRTKVTDRTTSALIHFSTISPRVKIGPVIKEAAKLLRVFCGGSIQSFILKKSKSSKKTSI